MSFTINRTRLIILLISLLLLASWLTSASLADSPAREGVRLLHSDATGLTVELRFGPLSSTLSQGYHRLSLPDTVISQPPGAPEVPTRGFLLGLPTTEGVTLDIVSAEYKTLTGYQLAPAPRTESTALTPDALTADSLRQTRLTDPSIYQRHAFYPAEAAELGALGSLRGQAVAQVNVAPVQYNPRTNELRHYSRIVIRLSWPAERLSQPNSARFSPAFESVLQDSLLNYASLDRPLNPPSRASTASAMQATPASTHSLKISVVESGMYRLDPASLTAAGFDLTGVDPANLSLSHRGEAIAIHVDDANANDLFDDGDSLIFYGEGIDSTFTTENMYWLTAASAPGLRMTTLDGTLGAAPLATAFPVTQRAEVDSLYWIMPGGPAEEDHWFWGFPLSPATSGLDASRVFSEGLTLNNVATTAATVTVQVRLKGFTELNHRLGVALNGTDLGEGEWLDQTEYDLTLSGDHSLLENGPNSVTLTALDTGEALPHQTLVNWIDLHYWDTYTAESDSLRFGPPSAGEHRFAVSGFSTDAIRIFDLSDPKAVKLVENVTLSETDGQFTAEFESTAALTSVYQALSEASYLNLSSAQLTLDSPSAWRSEANGADYIFITPAEFYTATQTLADFRANQGLRVATVLMEDIYDEFNGGVENPRAIRDFLDYAYHNWTAPSPTYVLLVGGATYDYRDLLDLERKTFVPAHLLVTEALGETPSDNWFVSVDGDDVLPDMLIGRLAAFNAADAEAMVNKIIDYEVNPPAEDWQSNFLFIADDGNPEDDDNEESFEILSEDLISRLPYYYTPEKVYLLSGQPQNPTQDIITAINSGQALVNYSGHGNRARWAQEELLTPSLIRTLNNTGRLAVVTVANCLNGYFIGSSESMAETFMNLPDKGAVAVWADTSLNYPSGHRLLLGEFYEAILWQDQYELGQATTTARVQALAASPLWQELLETFILFGDPATKFGLPYNYPYVEETQPANEATLVNPSTVLEISFNKPMVTTTVQLDPHGSITETLGTGSLELGWAVWNETQTVVQYPNLKWEPGRTYTFTISGQDANNTPLGSGPVPSTWSFSVAAAQIHLPLVLK